MSVDNTYTRILMTALCAALLTASCSEDDRCQEEDASSERPVAIGIRTRAEGVFSDVTYRACLFNEDGSLYSTGTYCDADPSVPDMPWLTPCAVNEDGSYAGRSADCGLYSRNGNYRMVLLSPAVAVPDNGRILQMRDWSEGQRISFSEPERVSVQHSTINNFFSYTMRSGELYERRARLTVNVICGEEVGHLELNSVALTDVIDEAYYDILAQSFSTEGVASSDAVRDIPLLTDAVSLCSPAVEGCPEEMEVATDIPVFAMDYSARDMNGNPLYRVPSLLLTMNDNEDEPFRISLNMNMRPMNDYTINVKVNTISLTVLVTPVPWIPVTPIDDGEISNNDGFLIEVPVSSWENGVTGQDGTTSFN